RLQKLKVLIEAFHPIGHPAGACLHEGDFKVWETLQKSADNNTQHGDHLFERMGHRVGVKRMIETLRSRGHAVARAYVNTYRHVVALRHGKERIKIGVVEVFSRRGNGRRGYGDEFELFDRAA